MAATREPLPVAPERPDPLYSKLSPGPGRSRVEVAAHQRERLLKSMVQITGERGYTAVTVRELAQLAGVSTRAFYEHFEGKEECFLRTYELVVRRATTRIVISQRGEPNWLERLHLAFAAFAQGIATKPDGARLALVEPFTAGPAALERTRTTEGAFETMVGEAFARAPGRPEVPTLILKGIVAGITSVARARLLTSREGELPGLVDELLDWTLSLCSVEATELRELNRGVAWASIPAKSAIAESLRRNEKFLYTDDRGLILSAVTKLAISEGCQQLTVPRIRDAAGVSQRSFSTEFTGVEDCFIAALDQRIRNALKFAAKYQTGRTWPEGVYRSISSFCVQIANDPMVVQFGFIEALAANTNGMRRSEGLALDIAKLIKNDATETHLPSVLDLEASAGAIWGVLHHSILAGRAQQLPRAAATLSFLALAPTIGPPEALETVRRWQSKGSKAGR